MKVETIARYTQLPVEDVREWVNLPSRTIYKHPKYVEAIRKLDSNRLRKTLPFVREAYEKNLDTLKKRLQTYYGKSVDLMSATTLGVQLILVVENPEKACDLCTLHSDILGAPVKKSLQILIDMLDEMPEGSEEWQQALCLLSFPMMNK